MKGGKRPLGYTILEVMIVLAVSGVMFLVALRFIDGKQAKTAFQQGSNEMASRIQLLVEDVTDGQYSDIPLSCNGSSDPVSFSSTPTAQGKNLNCTYLGKLMQFKENGDNTKYETFSLAGARQTAVGTPITDIANSKLAPVIAAGVDLTQHYTTPQNLEISSMTVTDNGGVHNGVFALGFVQGLGVAGDTDALGNTVNYKSGTQSIGLIYAPFNGTEDQNGAAAKITSGNVKYADSVCMIMTDGARYARITVGANHSQLNVRTKQLGTNVGTCP